MARVKHVIKNKDGEDWTVALTPQSAIRIKCQECMGWEQLPRSVKECTSPYCPLFPFREGKNPGMFGLTKGDRDAFKKIKKHG